VCIVAVSAAALGSLAAAPQAFGLPLTSGAACQSGAGITDPQAGKISGRGSTFQAVAIATFVREFSSDVCGTAASQYSGGVYGGDPAFAYGTGSSMVAYNYDPRTTGSGFGLSTASCRSDAFAGTDLPYTESQLQTGLDGAAGAVGGCPSVTTDPSAYEPVPATAYPPAGAKTTAAMVFPIAGGATAIGFNLGTSSCPAAHGGPPSVLNFTADEMTRMWQGEINRWNDAQLVANNPGLAACTGPSGSATNGAPIQRVVRAEASGTTAQFMTYLNHVDGAQLCDELPPPADTWAHRASQNPNTSWPNPGTPNGICVDLNGNTSLTVQWESGTAGIINCVDGASADAGCGDGSIGYGELGIWNSLDPAATLANLQTAASNGGTPVYISPGGGTAGSNCVFPFFGLPGGGNGQDAVSLNGQPHGTGLNNWASDAPTPKSDFTFQGSKYPICALTWDIVYSNLHIIGGANDPFPGLTANQRAQLYAFFSYVLTIEGQSGLRAAGYDPLPPNWVPTIRSGFQQFF
jgi:ABC-type phosphate transport system substrate-binding protein